MDLDPKAESQEPHDSVGIGIRLGSIAFLWFPPGGYLHLLTYVHQYPR